MAPAFVAVAKLEEIPLAGVKVATSGGVDLLVCRTETGEVFAVENLCTHEFSPLGAGRLVGCQIECPRHGARFDLRTGEATRLPAASPIRTFPVKVQGGQVWVAVGSSVPPGSA